MKCPNCGKKMKSHICKKCGYDSTAKTETPTSSFVATTNPAFQVNYYAYDPGNLATVYPVNVSSQAQPNPVLAKKKDAQPEPEQPTTIIKRKELKEMLKKLPKKERKATKKEVKKANKIAKKLAKKLNSEVGKTVRKNVASRLFGIILVGLSTVTSVGFDFSAVTDLSQIGTAWTPDITTDSLLSIVTSMFSSGADLFGVLPAMFANGDKGMLYNLSIYIFALFAIIAILYAIGAVFSREKSPTRVRRSLFFLGLGALVYAVSMAAMLGSGESTLLTDEMLSKMNMLTIGGYHVDVFSLLIGAGGVILSILFLLFRRRYKEEQEETKGQMSV